MNIRADLFLHNLVPIYIRAAMGTEESLAFKSLTGKALELVNNEHYQKWRATMAQELADLSLVENDLNIMGQDIAELKEELRIVAKYDTALTISQAIKDKERELAELKDNMRNKEEEKLGLEKLLSQAVAGLNTTNNNWQQVVKDIDQIQAYGEKLNEIETQRVVINKVQEERQGLEVHIDQTQENIQNLQNNLDVIRMAYAEWKAEINQIIRQVKVFLGVDFHDVITAKDYISNNIPALPVMADKLLGLIQTRQVLEADINSKNSSIAVLDEQLRHLQEKLNNYLNQLPKIDKVWQEYPYLERGQNELQINIDEANRNIVKLKQEKGATKTFYDRSVGSISSQKSQLDNKATQILKEHQKPVAIWEIDDMQNDLDIVERDIVANRKYSLHSKVTLTNFKEEIIKLNLNLSKLTGNQALDATKGKMDAALKAKIKQNLDLVVEDWLRRYAKSLDNIEKTIDEAKRLRTKFVKRGEVALAEDQLRDKIIATIKEAKIANFKNNLTSFKSMENHFQQELNRLSKDKSKAEEVMQQWTHRASIHVLRMIAALKDMVASMNYINEQGYAFPLVKLKGEDRLPRIEDDISNLLNEYFIHAIAKVIASKQDITTLTDHELKDLMGDKTIFAKAVQGRYPTLLVYKMSENNEFRYARAREEYYVTWEAINKGEGYSPEGSGGQTLSVNTFVIMMLISFKNKHLGNENPSTVLIMDNPFGKASSRHVLDPIFEIANKLNFQLICLASPDIIKVGISERFPIFWELKLEKGKVVHGGRVIRENFKG